MPIDIESSREEVLAAVEQDGLALQDASEGLRANREVVLAAVAQEASAFPFASTELLGDRDVVLAAAARNGDAILYASAELKADREVVLVAVAQDGEALEFASLELNADREVVLVAKRERGHEDVLLAAILNNPSLIQFFPTIPDEKIKSFFEKIDKDSCRAKTLLLPTYIDKNSLDKIQLFIKAQGNNHFIVKLPNDNEIDYEFKTSLAEQMLGAINGQLSLEPEPEHSEIFFNDANQDRQLNPNYFEKKQISLNRFMLPVLREIVVSKIPVELFSMLFSDLRLQPVTFCLFEHLTIKDFSKYVQVCRAMSDGDFVGEVVAAEARPAKRQKTEAAAEPEPAAAPAPGR